MIILINVFHVDPANQQRLLEILTEVTQDIVSKAKGFVSSTLHRSMDGTKVAMHARWASLADYEAMRQDSAPRPFSRRRWRSPASSRACTRQSRSSTERGSRAERSSRRASQCSPVACQVSAFGRSAVPRQKHRAAP